jgi:hypothetical protein
MTGDAGKFLEAAGAWQPCWDGAAGLRRFHTSWEPVPWQPLCCQEVWEGEKGEENDRTIRVEEDRGAPLADESVAEAHKEAASSESEDEDEAAQDASSIGGGNGRRHHDSWSSPSALDCGTRPSAASRLDGFGGFSAVDEKFAGKSSPPSSAISEMTVAEVRRCLTRIRRTWNASQLERERPPMCLASALDASGNSVQRFCLRFILSHHSRRAAAEAHKNNARGGGGGPRARIFHDSRKDCNEDAEDARRIAHRAQAPSSAVR